MGLWIANGSNLAIPTGQAGVESFAAIGLQVAGNAQPAMAVVFAFHAAAKAVAMHAESAEHIGGIRGAGFLAFVADHVADLAGTTVSIFFASLVQNAHQVDPIAAHAGATFFLGRA
jgi:hypothetical protein